MILMQEAELVLVESRQTPVRVWYAGGIFAAISPVPPDSQRWHVDFRARLISRARHFDRRAMYACTASRRDWTDEFYEASPRMRFNGSTTRIVQEASPIMSLCCSCDAARREFTFMHDISCLLAD